MQKPASLEPTLTGEILVDSPTAAKKLSCSLRHLDGLRLAGEVPHVRIGQLVRFSPRALDEWVAEKMQGKTGDSEA